MVKQQVNIIISFPNGYQGLTTDKSKSFPLFRHKFCILIFRRLLLLLQFKSLRVFHISPGVTSQDVLIFFWTFYR
ncbi:hypothetical protein SAMN04487894_11370 [Niabella drilacis]|uniref:Uncharacterized protein n=1 Tax=Niabella drilacis (strain DSM 25811 / CCM 8410 / CCUG 62505 / LMG 26954 / E90) TaxID=1285928 RepID=A0A1G6XJ69_NIADE|nr:hypothetical protein SAMN04487894_11370 [Niabella drilacis]